MKNQGWITQDGAESHHNYSHFSEGIFWRMVQYFLEVVVRRAHRMDSSEKYFSAYSESSDDVLSYGKWYLWMGEKLIQATLLFPRAHTESIVHFYFWCTFPFETKAAKNGTEVLNLVEKQPGW